ncbi:MAG: hypothetical protein WKG07_12280 [Hymenobacter sp.]
MVVVFQGAFTFLMTQVGAGAPAAQLFRKPTCCWPSSARCFMRLPTRSRKVYQHAEDGRRGDHAPSA